MDFVDRGDEGRLMDGDVDEAGAVVGGKVFWRFADVSAHGFEYFKFDFEKFDGGATDGDFGMGDEAGGDETHSFDGVFGDMVIDVLIDEQAALDDKTGSADTRDFDAETFEEETHILDHVVGGGADDGGASR